MVDKRSGKSTTPYTRAQEEQAAAVLRKRKEEEAKKELIKQAMKLALLEEQAAKKKKVEEEMEKLKREEYEKLKAVEEEEVEVEEEVPLERRTKTKWGESSGTKQDDQWMEKKILEWDANLSMGEEEEAMLYVPKAKQEAVVKEAEEAEDPLRHQTIEEDKKLEWKMRLAREKRQRLEAADKVAKELRVVEEQRQQMESQADVLGKMEIMARNIELLAKARQEQYQLIRGQDIALQSIHLGFREFARKMMMHVGTKVKARIENTE
ncbi:hypothetical protein CBR_g30878 [Chara braunii]|uniref:Uncharacterized protein n=1 Tax=Chara braunii TaxID=69332 RepID=A0A388LDW9_CHABU|nr:hypothetical protein CBR_g30878 [Chara braunii]|eukprot:GBG80413.1 hypothetical protein CBR_g30878 [Chara braunii]